MFNNIRGESQYNIEAVNTAIRLGSDHSFVAPEGVYEPRNVISLAVPTAHPLDPPSTALNPLAPTAHHPQTHSSGVRLSAVTIRYIPPPGSLENNIQQAIANNGNSFSTSLPAQQQQQQHQQSKSRWTTSFLGRKSVLNTPQSSSIPTTPIEERKNDPFADPFFDQQTQHQQQQHPHIQVQVQPQISQPIVDNQNPTVQNLGSSQIPLSVQPTNTNTQKKKGLLSLGSLNISTGNSHSKSCDTKTPTTPHDILVSHQPSALVGTTVVPPDAIGTSPLLSNLHVTVPIDPHDTEGLGSNGDLGLGKLGLSSNGTPINGGLTSGVSGGPGTSGNASSALTNTSNTGKRKRPKSNLVKNNSTFISRTIVNDNLSRRLADRTLDSEPVIWANVGRSLQWLDFSSKHASSMAATIPRDQYLSRILFTRSHPLCHDVNLYTRSAHGMDVVVGMSSGDAMWLDSASNKYHRINKNADIIGAAVTAIKWVPGSENLFFTLHSNGTLILLDKDREDGGFAGHGGLNYQDSRSTEAFRIVKSLYGDVPADGHDTATTTSSGGNIFFNYINKNSNEDDDGDSENAPKQFSSAKHNPLAVYKLSHKPLTAIEFSPDRQTAVIASADGYLRYFNLGTEVVTDFFPSYYDGFLTCAFSPDGKYLATGGKDDLVTIWSVKRRTVVARGSGHHSWVRKVAFDPWNCDLAGTSVADGDEDVAGATYRVGSVGDEGQLILWDFSPKTLLRPKAQHKKGSHNTASTANSDLNNRENSHTSSLKPVVSNHSLTNQTPTSNQNSLGGIGGSATNPYISRVHPFIAKDKVPQLTPVVQVTVRFPNKTTTDSADTATNGESSSGYVTANGTTGNSNSNNVNNSISAALMFGVNTNGGIVEPLSDLLFLEKTIVAASKDGKIWTWNRPSEVTGNIVRRR